MNLVIFEDSIRYDLGTKIILALSLALLIVLGILFYVDAEDSDIFPGELPRIPKVLRPFASAVFLLAVYCLSSTNDRCFSRGLILKFRTFNWNIPFAAIRSIEPASE
jgi:hypothetical protein